MKTLPHSRSCFVCGEANPIGLKLRFETDGRMVQTRFVPSPELIGFKQVVHGGIIATLLDEIMVWACVVQTRRFAFCAELSVRFLNQVRPQHELVATGQLESNRRDKIFLAKAELHEPSGLVLATAAGKYLPIKHADAAAMASDFLGDSGWLFKTP